MDKITVCVADLAAIADSVEARDLAEAKRRIELLFTEAATLAGGHFALAQRLRDQLGRVLTTNHGPAAKQFLAELISWLDREHRGSGGYRGVRGIHT
jgi:hypothetical protein